MTNLAMNACALDTDFGVNSLMAFPAGEVGLYEDMWTPREDDDGTVAASTQPQAFSLADGLMHELQASTRTGFSGRRGIGAGISMLHRVTTAKPVGQRLVRVGKGL
jgi:hypothetical protein